jgi:hypothetical protein
MFIKRHHCCNQDYCGTCGGLTFFRREFTRLRGSFHEADYGLAEVTASEFGRMPNAGQRVDVILSLVDGNREQLIWGAWGASALLDDVFAADFFLSMWSSRRMPEAVKAVIDRQAAARARKDTGFIVTMQNNQLMNKLAADDWPATASILEKSEPARLQREEETQRQRWEQHQAKRDEERRAEAVRREKVRAGRERHGEELADVPLPEALETLLADASIPFEHFPEDIVRSIEPGIVADLPRDLRDRLLSWPVLRGLAQKTEQEIIRRRTKGLNLRDKLAHLLGDDSIPLEAYPTEIAAVVDDATIEALPAYLATRFSSMLETAEPQCWRAVKKRLSKKHRDRRTRERMRVQLRGKPQAGWLQFLLEQESLSLSSYPAEVIHVVDDSVFRALPRLLAERFHVLLEETNIGRWNALGVRLGLVDDEQAKGGS